MILILLDPLLLAGDRRMIKGPQIKALHEEGFHFITAITKPQIEALLTLSLSLRLCWSE